MTETKTPQSLSDEIKIFNALASIEGKIKAEGATKDGKGNYNKIYSLDQLNALIRKHQPEGFHHRFVGIAAEHTPVGSGHVVRTNTQLVFVYNDAMISIPVAGIGTDRNDGSFAEGKGLSYSKRYTLGGLLNMPSGDLDPEKPGAVLAELRLAIANAFKNNPEVADKMKESWKAKYKADFDASKIKDIDMLRNIANQLEGRA